MAYNKSKHVDAAQKHLSQGRLPQAISEYQQILKHEPKDQVTLMTLGDLFVRQGETFQALEYFERLAQIFLSDGFTTKAIAIYKKIAKLAPEESRPLERLAELYVQQGVMSEARPLYLQLAEVHLKAGRQPQAVALLRKLLEAEPDNLRVQLRLGDLYIAMGQKKEALETFQSAAHRVFDHGDAAEAVRLADRALQVDSAHVPTLGLKARALAASGKRAEAAKMLESLPGAETGGDTTTLLLDQYLEAGETAKAVALADKVFTSDPKNYEAAHRIASTLLESGELDQAQSLLGRVRDAMIDSGDHERLAQTLSRLAERRPGQIEPLEWLVDLYGRASDSFRLPDALAQLAQAHERAGNDAVALETYQKLLDRNPEDESTRRRYMQLRKKMGLEASSAEIPPPVKLAPAEPEMKISPAAPAPQVAPGEVAMDEETDRYVTQALTDVDLFSSYGLTQKAVDLLEEIVQRAPKHSAALERLLDFSLGAGSDRRTAELAAQLEKIYVERGDRQGAERFTELRQRFQRAAGITTADVTASAKSVTQEFAVPTVDATPVVDAMPAVPAIPLEPAEPASPAQQASAAPPAESAVHEVDLSEEWAALSQQLDDAMHEAPPVPAPRQAEPAHEPLPVQPEASTDAPETLPAKEPPPVEGEEILEDEEAAPELAQPEPAPPPAAEAPAAPVKPEPAAQPEEPVLADAEDFDIELEPVAPESAAPAGPSMSADEFLTDLVNEFEAATSSLKMPGGGNSKGRTAPAAKNAPAGAPANQVSPGSAKGAKDGAPAGPLGDVFEEFRAELGELGKEDEDLETHYNLGIAYREMGLLEEAISEFQRVAKANDKGQAFRYAMQCCTLLGLAFMEKGQPAIAAMWYERALLTPGLDQESILALQYDLGVAQETAGDAAAAFKSFTQVYAMNIDYRDVAERIALLGKAR